MADPAIAADNKRFVEMSRRYAALGEIVTLGQALRTRHDDAEVARELLAEADQAERDDLRAEIADAEADIARLEEELKVLLLPKDPNDGRNVIVEIRGAEGGEEANLFARDLYEMYRSWASAQGWRFELLNSSALRPRRLQRGDLQPGRRRGVDQDEVRGRTPPGPAGAGHRVPGPDPHVLGHGDRAARGRGGRPRHRSERPAVRHLPVVGGRRSARQHHRFGGPGDPPPDRRGGVDAGREEPAPESGAGPQGPPVPAPAASRGGAAPGRGLGRPPRARPGEGAGRRRSGPTTTRRTGSPTIGSVSPSTSLDRIVAGDLDEISDALVTGRAGPPAPGVGFRVGVGIRGLS